MKLLCILAKHPRKLVTREELIREIWNDYGGGEAGLTHSISTLRKILGDGSKELIETIPTKGYILHAEISDLGPVTAVHIARPKGISKRVAAYAFFGLIAIIIICSLFLFKTADTKEASAFPPTDFSTPFAEVNKAPAETWLNTITTTSDDSTEYKLKVVGDGRPEFYVNGKLQSPDEMEKHLKLIHNLQKQLRRRTP